MKKNGKGADNQTGEEDEKEPIALDGGYGWVILMASFFSSVIVDGVCFAFGIFYLEFLDYFKENKGKTAWIGSVLNGMYMIMGPLAGALANRFGCRAVAMAGSLWSATAFFLSTMAPNLNALILTYGVLAGAGFGLMYLPSIVIVGFYFDKKRAFATGIATCGSGIGAFIFAPLCKWLIDEYGWQGAQWIISAIVLNGVVLGALYRPLTLKEIERYRKKWRKRQEKKKLKRKNTAEDDDFKYMDTKDIDLEASPDKMYAIHSLTYNENPDISLRMRSVNKSTNEANTKEHQLSDSWHSLSGYASSMDNIQKTSPHDNTTSEVSNNKIIKNTDRFSNCLGTFKEILRGVLDTMDVSMLRNPVFDIYAISCILCMAGFFVPFIYLPDKAIGMGYSSNRGAFLLSILGLTNTVGRIITGWISDRPWADCLIINNCCLVVGGIATILCPFCNNYVLVAFYACIFGICIAAFVSLRSIILVDLIGLDKLTSAFGIIVLCQGLTSFIGAPIAGSLFDLTGNYNASFYVAGTAITLSGLICFPLRRIAKWHACRQHATSSQPDESENSSTTEPITQTKHSAESICVTDNETVL